MKATRRTSFIVVGVLIGVSILALLLVDREPRHQGKPASYWLDHWTTYQLEAMEESIAAFEAMGERGIQFLTRTIETTRSKLDLKVSAWAERNDLPKWIASRLPDEFIIRRRRVTAIDLLAGLAPDARSAVPALRCLCKNSAEEAELRASARRALNLNGEEASK